MKYIMVTFCLLLLFTTNLLAEECDQAANLSITDEVIVPFSDSVTKVIEQMVSDIDDENIYTNDLKSIVVEDEKTKEKSVILGPLNLIKICEAMRNDNMFTKKSVEAIGAPSSFSGNDTGFTASLDTCLKVVFEKYDFDLQLDHYLVSELAGKKTNGKTPQTYTDIIDVNFSIVHKGEGKDADSFIVIEYRDASSKRDTMVKIQDMFHQLINASKYYDNISGDYEDKFAGVSYGKKYTLGSKEEGGSRIILSASAGLNTKGEVYGDAGVRAEASFFDSRLNTYAEYEQRLSSANDDRKVWFVGVEGCGFNKAFCAELAVGDHDDKYTKNIKDDDLIFKIGISTTIRFK